MDYLHALLVLASSGVLTSGMQRELHLNLFINGKGHHEAAWRHPQASSLRMTDFAYYHSLAARAEAAAIDAIFLADTLVLNSDVGGSVRGGLEPVTALAALAASTTQIGLIATASTTYTEPYNLARQFATLDHISRGRVGWNIVTTYSPEAGYNFGQDRTIAHAERYERAEEFMSVVTALWDSWADDAIIENRNTGQYADESRIRPASFKGNFYQVAGALNVPRSPQGHPVLVQAGSSDDGRAFASRHAEAVFTAHLEKATAQDFYRDLKSRAVENGRSANEILILPGFSPVIAGTETEARRILDELDDLANPEIGRARISVRFGGHDFSHLPLDRPLTVDDFPDPSTVQAARSRTEIILERVRRESPTLRQLLRTMAGARGHFTAAGTPEQIADHIETWYREGAADGFNIMPSILPSMLDAFVDEVIPILRKRGLFRSRYAGNTLREHYGLSRPTNHYFA
jgi:FMN-dependent oxidoreductase (nitrilotriacetate monooxygenase family)